MNTTDTAPALIDLIPGGAHTYSKGPDQFPTNAPGTVVKGAGARVLGCDGRWYIDWGMGLTSVSLGHGHAEVCAAVTEAIADGVNFVRPSELERTAAVRFLEVFGGDMVKFCKNGSVATTAAVKLARAHTKRKIVAVPYEHPFFSYDDWFIGTTAAYAGIPEEIRALTMRFHYNDLESLEAVFAQAAGNVACVMLEPVKFDEPRPGFLEGVRALCDKHGAVLVLDETVSGLKWSMRGGGEYFKVRADLSVWGKGLANGFSACALSGRRDIMALGGSNQRGERVFLVSTTHGAESSALAAMLKTLEIFERDRVIETNWLRGAALKQRLLASIEAAGMAPHITVLGYPCLLLVTWTGQPEARALEWKTLLFQELVREGILFQGVMYPTASHDDRVCDETVTAFERALPRVADAWKSGSVQGYLNGPAIRPVFRTYQECVKGRCGRLHPDEPKEPCCGQ